MGGVDGVGAMKKGPLGFFRVCKGFTAQLYGDHNNAWHTGWWFFETFFIFTRILREIIQSD